MRTMSYSVSFFISFKILLNVSVISSIVKRLFVSFFIHCVHRWPFIFDFNVTQWYLTDNLTDLNFSYSCEPRLLLHSLHLDRMLQNPLRFAMLVKPFEQPTIHRWTINYVVKVKIDKWMSFNFVYCCIFEHVFTNVL